MREKGLVTCVSGGRATIRLAEGPGCTRCGLCRAVGGGEREIEIAAAQDISLGDEVEIIVEPGLRLKASTLIFLIPLLAFIVALSVAEYCLGGSAYRDPLSLLFGLASAAGAFMVVACYDRKLRMKGVELIRAEKVIDDQH